MLLKTTLSLVPLKSIRCLHLYLTLDPPNPGGDFVPAMPFQEVLEIMRENDKMSFPDLRGLDKHVFSFEPSSPLGFVYQANVASW